MESLETQVKGVMMIKILQQSNERKENLGTIFHAPSEHQARQQSKLTDCLWEDDRLPLGDLHLPKNHEAM